MLFLNKIISTNENYKFFEIDRLDTFRIYSLLKIDVEKAIFIKSYFCINITAF